MVVTKTDETRRFGVFTTLVCETQCPVAFLTNGQRVPQDIMPADFEEIVKMVMGEKREAAVGGPVAVELKVVEEDAKAEIRQLAPPPLALRAVISSGKIKANDRVPPRFSIRYEECADSGLLQRQCA